MLKSFLIDDHADLDELCAEWDDLASRSRTATMFQTWEWVSTHWRHYGQGKRLLIVTVRDDGRLVGIAPLQVSSMYRLPLRRVQFIGNGITDYQDFILDPDMEHPVLRAILDCLQTLRSRWDIIDLGQMPSGSPTLEALSSCSKTLDWTVDMGRYMSCHYLPLPATWEELLPSLGKHTGKNLAYKERLIAREFDAELCELTSNEIDAGLAALYKLHTKSWNERGLPGVVAGQKVRGFYTETAYLFAKRDWLRLYGLRLNGELQSVHFCFSYKDKAYGYIGGWEPSLSRYGLGLTLTAFAIKEAVRRGMREFDLLSGDEEYKAHWTKLHRDTYRLHVHRGSFRSSIAHLVSHAERRVGSRTRTLFTRCIMAMTQGHT